MKRAPPDAKAVARRAIAFKYVTMIAAMTPPAHVLTDWRASWSHDDLKGFYSGIRKEQDTMLEEAGPWKSAFTPRERAFMSANLLKLKPREHIDMGWCVESLNVLAWALRARPTLPPYHRQISPKSLRHFASGDLRGFVASAKLRARREIEKARDLAEFWHWRSRTRELAQTGKPPFEPPVDGIESYDDIVRMAAVEAGKRGDFRPIRQDFPAFGRAYRELTEDQWSDVRSITSERHRALNWLCGYAPRNSWAQTPTDT